MQPTKTRGTPVSPQPAALDKHPPGVGTESIAATHFAEILNRRPSPAPNRRTHAADFTALANPSGGMDSEPGETTDPAQLPRQNNARMLLQRRTRGSHADDSDTYLRSSTPRRNSHPPVMYRRSLSNGRNRFRTPVCRRVHTIARWPAKIRHASILPATW